MDSNTASLISVELQRVPGDLAQLGQHRTVGVVHGRRLGEVQLVGRLHTVHKYVPPTTPPPVSMMNTANTASRVRRRAAAHD